MMAPAAVVVGVTLTTTALSSNRNTGMSVPAREMEMALRRNAFTVRTAVVAAAQCPPGALLAAGVTGVGVPSSAGDAMARQTAPYNTC